MTRILIATALLALTVAGLIEMMVVVGKEPVHAALLNSFDIGWPMLETVVAIALLGYLVRRHPMFRRLPLRVRR